MSEQFVKAVNESFSQAFGAAAAKIHRMLLEQRRRNQQDENGVQVTVMTLLPKIRIELSNDDGFQIESRVTGKQQEVVTGVCKVSFNPGQPELNFEPAAVRQSGTAEAQSEEVAADIPSEDTFWEVISAYAGLSEERLQAYFAGSNRWKDYAGWIAAGNGAEAAAMIDDPERMESFARLVIATLAPADAESENDNR